MMQASQAPSSLSFKGRLGYLLAQAGFFGTLSAYLYRDLHPLPLGFTVLSTLLLVVGILLVVLDPYTKIAKFRLLVSNVGVTKSDWGRLGYFLAFGGTIYMAMRLEGLQPNALNEMTSPYWLVAVAALILGTFLFLRD